MKPSCAYNIRQQCQPNHRFLAKQACHQQEETPFGPSLVSTMTVEIPPKIGALMALDGAPAALNLVQEVTVPDGSILTYDWLIFVPSESICLCGQMILGDFEPLKIVWILETHHIVVRIYAPCEVFIMFDSFCHALIILEYFSSSISCMLSNAR